MPTCARCWGSYKPGDWANHELTCPVSLKVGDIEKIKDLESRLALAEKVILKLKLGLEAMSHTFGDGPCGPLPAHWVIDSFPSIARSFQKLLRTAHELDSIHNENTGGATK